MSIQGDHHLNSKVLEIVKEVAGKEIVSSKTDLSSLGIDSMVKLDILTSLEKKFNVELNESSIREFVNIKTVYVR